MIIDGPEPALLVRTIDQEDVAHYCERAAWVIERAVNFGTHLITWIIKEHGDPVESRTLVPLTLFRHVIEHADSVAILIRAGSPSPCSPLVRTAFEAMLGLQYMLASDTETRAACYRYCHLRDELDLALSLDRRTPEGKAKHAELSGDVLFPSVAKHEQLALQQAGLIRASIARPCFAGFDEAWNNARGKSKSLPRWYALFGGPKSIRQLAKHLDHAAMYDFLYRSWSGHTHASSGMKSFERVEQEFGAIKPLRSPEGVEQVATITATLVVSSIRFTVNALLPSQSEDFARWYDKQMRSEAMWLADNIGALKVVLDGSTDSHTKS